MVHSMRISGGSSKVSRAAAPLLLIAAVVALIFCCSWSWKDTLSYDKTETTNRYLEAAAQPLIDHSEKLQMLRDSEDIWFSIYRNKDMYAELKEKQKIQLQLRAELLERQQGNNFEPLSVCGRHTNVGTMQDLALLQHFNMDTCPGANSKNLLLIQGDLAHGRTGNNLIEFLHGLQLAHDEDYQLAITPNSWAFDMLLKMWFNSSHDDDWEAKFEKAFCVKIVHPNDSLKGWNLVPHQLNPRNSVIITKHLFNYESELPLDEYVAFQSRFIQTLFRHYNTAPEDMCSGINAIFGEERTHVVYSAIHNRHLEGAPGVRLMQRMSRGSGCHPTAALEMEPEYVKSILKPIGMLNHPIVLITDGQNPEVARRLIEDPEIGPMLRLVPESASWIGGDLTLAIMSNVFIGNPASSFSGFIAKSRIAFGFGQNHLFRAKLSTDIGKVEWVTTCGDACIFDKKVMGNMS